MDAEVFAGEGYSNFDHLWNAGAKEAIDNGARMCHSAWNFHGEISKNGDTYEEEVWQYHSLVKTVTAPTLDELVLAVCDEFGHG